MLAVWPGVGGIFLRGQQPQDNSVGSGVVWVTGLFSLCWEWQGLGGPHVGPMNFAIWELLLFVNINV